MRLYRAALEDRLMRDARMMAAQETICAALGAPLPPMGDGTRKGKQSKEDYENLYGEYADWVKEQEMLMGKQAAGVSGL